MKIQKRMLYKAIKKQRMWGLEAQRLALIFLRERDRLAEKVSELHHYGQEVYYQNEVYSITINLYLT